MAPMILFYTRVAAAVVVPVLPVILVICFGDRLRETDNPALIRRFWAMCVAAFATGFFFTLNAPYSALPTPFGPLLAFWGVLFGSVAIFIAILYAEARRAPNWDERNF